MISIFAPILTLVLLSEGSSIENIMEEVIEAERDGEFIKAEKLLLSIVDLDPANYKALTHLGWVYQNLGYKRLSQSYYERALKINPFYLDALEGLFWLYMETKRFSNAKELLKRLEDIGAPENILSRLKSALENFYNFFCTFSLSKSSSRSWYYISPEVLVSFNFYSSFWLSVKFTHWKFEGLREFSWGNSFGIKFSYLLKSDLLLSFSFFNSLKRGENSTGYNSFSPEFSLYPEPQKSLGIGLNITSNGEVYSPFIHLTKGGNIPIDVFGSLTIENGEIKPSMEISVGYKINFLTVYGDFLLGKRKFPIIPSLFAFYAIPEYQKNSYTLLGLVELSDVLKSSLWISSEKFESFSLFTAGIKLLFKI
jgi:tetratricopeptide (TPR) repeat protein